MADVVGRSRGDAEAMTTPTPAADQPGSLLARARSLRIQSQQVHPVLAAAYRRRSAELSLQAWLHVVKGTPAPADIDDFTTLAA
jgi:hypothetical protein